LTLEEGTQLNGSFGNGLSCHELVDVTVPFGSRKHWSVATNKKEVSVCISLQVLGGELDVPVVGISHLPERSSSNEANFAFTPFPDVEVLLFGKDCSISRELS
jgi:hypothetical protein